MKLPKLPKVPKHGSDHALKNFEAITPSRHDKSSAGVPTGFKQRLPGMQKPMTVMKTPKLPGC